MSNSDEAARTALGYRGPQNYGTTGFMRMLFPFRKVFRNHLSADRVRAEIPAETWASYRSFTIVRNPYDRAISRYFWELKRKKGRAVGLSFEEFFLRHRELLTENMHIGPLSGPNELDFFLRYEKIDEDLAANDLGFLSETYHSLSAKSGHRPANGSTPAEMYCAHPLVAELISDVCKEEIDRFGYQSPI